jgi:hypothetical protein
MNEVIETTPLVAAELDRAQIDVQIATAHKFPRSVKKFQDSALSLATINIETAASCFYKLPRFDKKTGETKNIEGPSVRLAEIAASCWGNMRVQARIIGDDGKFVVAQGVAHDLENNLASSVEVRRKITDKKGNRFSDDMVGVTANAACSIALRNAIFKVVPKALVDVVYQQAKKTAVGNAATLSERRERALAFFNDKLGISRERVLKALGKTGVQDINLQDVETMLGWHSAIQDGDAEIDTIFPEVKDFAPKPTDAPAPAQTQESVAPSPAQSEETVAPDIFDEAPYPPKNQKEPDPFPPLPQTKPAEDPERKINKAEQTVLSNVIKSCKPGALSAVREHLLKAYEYKTSGEIRLKHFSEIIKWIEDREERIAKGQAA